MIATRSLGDQIAGRWRRSTIQRLGRRTCRLDAGPYVSFTFDDFPRSALVEGGRILEAHGVRGTYFVSCGLLGSMSPSGQIASSSDLSATVRNGHELGCHTFDHLDGTLDSPAAFERSIAANRTALTGHGLRAALDVFAYPLSGPDLGVKRLVSRHFTASRWGGQTFNRGAIDLNLLKSYFIDKRSRDDVDGVARLIRLNAEQRGWLIFSTHDIADDPSDYGCSADYFAAIVRLAVASGAQILPMGRVCADIGARRPLPQSLYGDSLTGSRV